MDVWVTLKIWEPRDQHSPGSSFSEERREESLGTRVKRDLENDK